MSAFVGKSVALCDVSDDPTLSAFEGAPGTVTSFDSKKDQYKVLLKGTGKSIWVDCDNVELWCSESESSDGDIDAESDDDSVSDDNESEEVESDDESDNDDESDDSESEDGSSDSTTTTSAKGTTLLAKGAANPSKLKPPGAAKSKGGAVDSSAKPTSEFKFTAPAPSSAKAAPTPAPASKGANPFANLFNPNGTHPFAANPASGTPVAVSQSVAVVGQQPKEAKHKANSKAEAPSETTTKGSSTPASATRCTGGVAAKSGSGLPAESLAQVLAAEARPSAPLSVTYLREELDRRLEKLQPGLSGGEYAPTSLAVGTSPKAPCGHPSAHIRNALAARAAERNAREGLRSAARKDAGPIPEADKEPVEVGALVARLKRLELENRRLSARVGGLEKPTASQLIVKRAAPIKPPSRSAPAKPPVVWPKPRTSSLAAPAPAPTSVTGRDMPVGAALPNQGSCSSAAITPSQSCSVRLASQRAPPSTLSVHNTVESAPAPAQPCSAAGSRISAQRTAPVMTMAVASRTSSLATLSGKAEHTVPADTQACSTFLTAPRSSAFDTRSSFAASRASLTSACTQRLGPCSEVTRPDSPGCKGAAAQPSDSRDNLRCFYEFVRARNALPVSQRASTASTLLAESLGCLSDAADTQPFREQFEGQWRDDSSSPASSAQPVEDAESLLLAASQTQRRMHAISARPAWGAPLHLQESTYPQHKSGRYLSEADLAGTGLSREELLAIPTSRVDLVVRPGFAERAKAQAQAADMHKKVADAAKRAAIMQRRSDAAKRHQTQKNVQDRRCSSSLPRSGLQASRVTTAESALGAMLDHQYHHRNGTHSRGSVVQFCGSAETT